MMTSHILLPLAALIVSVLAASGANTTPASRAPQPSDSAAGASFAPQFSADGQHLVFISHANNLVTNDNLAPWLDVFVRDLASSNTVLVSVNTSGIGGGNADAHSPSISSNGQFIAFVSRASNLVPGDTNSADDVFVRNIVSGSTTLVSVDVNGSSPVDPNLPINIPLSGNPLISDDGHWVIFESRATNLAEAPAPLGSVNIYARDTWSNATVLVSANTNGFPVSEKLSLSGLSADGRFAAFISTNTSIAAGVTNVGGDVFVRDLQTASTLWASSNNALLFNGTYTCSSATLARDGSGAAFLATVSDGTVFPIYVHLQTRIASRLHLSGVSNVPPVISADGSTVAFEGGSNAFTQVYFWNRNSNAVIAIHQKLFGNFPNSPTHVDALSSDGRFALIRERGSDDFTNGFIGRYQLFRKDATDGTLQLISAATNGGASSDSFEFAATSLSLDGNLAAFDSTASDLVIRDFNNASDVFLRDISIGFADLISKQLSTRGSSVGVSLARINPLSISSNANRIVFTRLDEPGAYRDTNGWADVFLSDFASGTSFALSINTNVYIDTSGGGAPVTNVPPNTNTFTSAIISANGNTVAALTPRSLIGILPSSTDIMVARASNGMFNTEMRNAAPLYQNSGTVGSSGNLSLSADGSLLAFQSTSTRLTEEADGNNASDVFVRYFDRTNIYPWLNGPTNFLISKATSFQSGNGMSVNPMISPDGRWVAFLTLANNLVSMTATDHFNPPQPAFTYAALQLAAADIGTNRADTNFLERFTTRLCSYTIISNTVFTAGTQDFTNSAVKPLTNAVTSFTFASAAPYLFFGVTNAEAIYRHDLMGTRLTDYEARYLSNGLPAGQATNGLVPGATNLLVCTNCGNPSVSADGNLVAFERVRAGTNIVDLYATDLRDGSQTMVSANLTGAPANGTSTSPLISGDGRYVVFQSKASDLVLNDTNGFTDIFVRDRLLGVTMLVSANTFGRSGNGPSTAPVLGPDGRTVAFQSFASDLAPGDFNDKRDVFVLALGSADSDHDGLDDDWELTYFSGLSRDGNGDFDNDGVSDRDEFLAGTDPTAIGSFFRVLTLTPLGGNSTRVIWNGNPALNYRVEFKDDVSSPMWTMLNAPITWNGNAAMATDPSATNAHRFYRAVRLP